MYRRKSTPAQKAEALGLFIIALLKLAALFLITWTLEGVTLMYAVGQLHAWTSAVPAMGFYTAMSVGFWLSAFITVPVGSSIRANISKRHRS